MKWNGIPWVMFPLDWTLKGMACHSPPYALSRWPALLVWSNRAKFYHADINPSPQLNFAVVGQRAIIRSTAIPCSHFLTFLRRKWQPRARKQQVTAFSCSLPPRKLNLDISDWVLYNEHFYLSAVIQVSALKKKKLRKEFLAPPSPHNSTNFKRSFFFRKH